MEDVRRKLAQDSNLYPSLNTLGRKPRNDRETSPSVISIASSSEGSASSPVKPRRRAVIISSDEENDPIPPKATTKNPSAPKGQWEPPVVRPTPAAVNATTGRMPQIPGSYPDQRYTQDMQSPPKTFPPLGMRPAPAAAAPPSNQTWESFTLPNDMHLYDPRKTAAEAEKDLRNLVDANFDVDGETVIDEELRRVPGFRDDIQLLDHQVLGRVWMAERETGKKLGGILADDMGLGKTVQTLTRIMDHRPKKADAREGWAAPTLIVCPLALISQWASEIVKYCRGKLVVIEHHGPKRDSDPVKLERSHIVITSYSVVASEYSTYVPVESEDERAGKGKKKVALSSSSGDDSDSADNSDASDGPSNKRIMKVIGKKTVYRASSGQKDALFRVRWWRIVLDEAHNIKNRNTKSAIACCALKGKYRWCLTGTPMQNSVEELYSLIKFLQIRPLNDWQTFNDQIAKPVKSGRSVRAMKRLQVVLKAIMLRRRKDHILNGKPILDLPARNIEVVHCDFSDSERHFYDAVQAKVEDSLNKIMGSEKRSYTSILLLLLRLRQACNHPMLISKDYKDDSEAVEPIPARNGQDEDDDDDLASMFGQLNVKTVACEVCLVDITPRNRSNDDPKHCIDCAMLAASGRGRSRDGLPPESAKIREMLRILRKIEDRGENEKTIIFSQFTSMLDLMQPFLHYHNIKYVRYDGSMRKDQREASLEKIKTSKSTRVILISFKAGSTGLNLTACNNVILFDLWWNPALEDQAFDRTHRLGQNRDVNIFKLTIEDTVEERILALQDKKRELAKAALSGDKLNTMRLGMDDLLALFRPGRDDEDEEE